jgi:hypothetical protein
MAEDNTRESKRNIAYQIGVFVFVVLGMLTLGEFAISVVAPAWWWALVLIALIKAYYILRDYMHLGRLFSGDEEEHE